MSDESAKKTKDSSETELKQPTNKSRRSFAKAGIMAPVMLSLANRPAWGANVRCTVSGFGSLATIGSGVMPSETTCNYDSADTVLMAECGIGGAGGHAIMLSDIFGCIAVGSADDATLCDVLNSTIARWDKLMVTAWYNQHENKNPFGSTSVADVYCAFHGGATVYGFSGVMMTKDEIMYFLATVMGMTSYGTAVIYVAPQRSSTTSRRR